MLRVLWVTNGPIAYGERYFKLKPISGRWMEPTLMGLANLEDVKISVATIAQVEDLLKLSNENVDYYFVPKSKKNIYEYNKELNHNIWENIFEDFKPDIVMQWGTETFHGLTAIGIAKSRNIPYAIEIQGVLDSIAQFYLSDFRIVDLINSITIRNFLKNDFLINQRAFFMKKARLEQKALCAANNILVENEWAEARCLKINPKAKFYYHREDIGSCFFDLKWDYDKCERESIFTCAPGYPLKGTHVLIKALSLIKRTHPNVKLYIPGMESPFNNNIKSIIKRTSYDHYLKNLIKKLRLEHNVIFLGVLSQAEMASQMMHANVLVIPSAIENQSITLREGLTIGTPCVGSAVGAIPESVKHGVNGFLYRHEEYQALAYYVSKLFEDKNLALDFSTEARKSMRSYPNLEESSKKLYKTYQKIIKDNLN